MVANAGRKNKLLEEGATKCKCRRLIFTFRIAPGHELVTVTETYLELANSDNLLFGPVEISYPGSAGSIVKVAPDHMHVGRERLEIIERVSGAQIAGAEYVLDAARYQKLLEFGRE